MSFVPVSIGARSNAGARSILLGGADLGSGRTLQTLGLLARANRIRGDGDAKKD